jgi:hypothetical protein
MFLYFIFLTGILLLIVAQRDHCTSTFGKFCCSTDGLERSVVNSHFSASTSQQIENDIQSQQKNIGTEIAYMQESCQLYFWVMRMIINISDSILRMVININRSTCKIRAIDTA